MGIKVDVKKHETAAVMSERDKELARQVEEYNVCEIYHMAGNF